MTPFSQIKNLSETTQTKNEQSNVEGQPCTSIYFYSFVSAFNNSLSRTQLYFFFEKQWASVN